MKPFLIAFLFFTFQLSIFSQNNSWKAFDTPTKTSAEIIYQSKSGILISKLNINNTGYLSKDIGKTWNALNIPMDVYYMKFKEDSIGNIYYFKDYNILQLDLKLYSEKKIFQISGNYKIVEIEFLTNNDIAVLTTNALQIYSFKGVLKSSYDINSSKGQIIKLDSNRNLLEYGIGTPNYYLEFNNDLSIVTKINSNNNFNYGKILFNNKRLFQNDRYSDDFGKTWIELKPNKDFFPSDICLGYNNKIYFLYFQSLYISNDNGQTFIKKDLPTINTCFISYNVAGQLVIGGKIGNIYFIKISDDDGDSWKDLPTTISYQYVFKFTAGINEKFALYESGKSYYKPSKDSTWKTLNYSTNLFDTLNSDFLFLANNSLIALNINYRPIRSFDNGKTWNKISEEFIDRYKLGFFEKSGVIYGTSTNTIIYSSDYGVTWNSFFDKNVSFTSINIAGSSTSRAFIFNKNTSYNSIIK